MSSYTGKLNFLKFKNACIVTVKGKSEAKRGIFIPIEDNNIFISADENLKPKGAFIDFFAWENRELGKFGDTHSLRQSLSKEIREKLTDEKLKSTPFFGNMKPFEIANAANSVAAPLAEADDDSELPF